jgi:hypothetical protein
MTWLPNVDPGTFEQVMALRPDLAGAHAAFVDAFTDVLDQPVRDACRIRVAQVLGRPDLAADVAGPDRVAAVARWSESDAVSDDERVVLDLTESFVVDPHAVTAAQRAAVRDRFGEAGLVAVVEWLAILDGIVRFQTVLGIPAGAAGDGGS